MVWNISIRRESNQISLANRIRDAKVDDSFTKCGTLEDEFLIMQWMMALTESVTKMQELNIVHQNLQSENIFLNYLDQIQSGNFGLVPMQEEETESAGELGTCP